MLAGGGPRSVEEAEEDGVEDGAEEHPREVEQAQTVRLVELVLAEDAVEDPVAVVRVKDALNTVQEGRDDGNVGSEEQWTVW